MNTLKALLKSRKLWVALAGVLAVVLVQVGVSEERADAISAAIVTLAGLVIAGVAWEDGSAKRSGMPPPSMNGLLLVLLSASMLAGCAQNNEPAPRMSQHTSGPTTPQDQQIRIAPVINIYNGAGVASTQPASGFGDVADGRGKGQAPGGGIVLIMPNWIDASTAASPRVGDMSPRTGGQNANVEAEQRPETQVNPSLAVAAPGGAASATASGTAAFDQGQATGAPVANQPNQTPQYLNLRVPTQQAEGLLGQLLNLLTGRNAPATQPVR